MSFGFGPSIRLHAEVTSPFARTNLRKLYRSARRCGNTKFDSRLAVARALLAVKSEGDEAFASGIRAEQLARRAAVRIVAGG
jgi:hypothetical protein